MIPPIVIVAALAYALYGFALGCYWSLCDSINADLCDALQEAYA